VQFLRAQLLAVAAVLAALVGQETLVALVAALWGRAVSALELLDKVITAEPEAHIKEAVVAVALALLVVTRLLL
jgi:hypothetical protein